MGASMEMTATRPARRVMASAASRTLSSVESVRAGAGLASFRMREYSSSYAEKTLSAISGANAHNLSCA